MHDTLQGDAVVELHLVPDAAVLPPLSESVIGIKDILVVSVGFRVIMKRFNEFEFELQIELDSTPIAYDGYLPLRTFLPWRFHAD
ncbi:MAG TPA: hypothetical protein VIM58_06140 [Candidatus Methylacidiphilales bacterium]